MPTWHVVGRRVLDPRGGPAERPWTLPPSEMSRDPEGTVVLAGGSAASLWGLEKQGGQVWPKSLEYKAIFL